MCLPGQGMKAFVSHAFLTRYNLTPQGPPRLLNTSGCVTRHIRGVCDNTQGARSVHLSTRRTSSLVDQTSESTASKRSTWLLTSGYFWFFAGIGAFTPYVALYYRDLGFSGLQLGILTSLPSIATALTGPLWGALADSLAIHRKILRVVLVIAALMALLATQAATFVPFLFIIGVVAVSLVPIPALLDSYAVTIGERVGRSFGSFRVWGSIGFIVVVLVMGQVMAGGISSRFLVAYAICIVMTWASMFTVPKLFERRPRPLLDGLHSIKRNRPFLLVLLVAYLLASGMGVVHAYLGIHIRELGGGADLVGIAYAAAGISEIPVVAFGGWLMARMGAHRLVIVALVMYSVRFVALGFVGSPSWVIAAQTLHGLTFGAFMVASVTMAHRLVGRENAATAQALLGTMSFGFGAITGSLGGGALLDVVGTTMIFRGVAGLMLIALTVYIVGNRIVGADQCEERIA